MFPTNKNSLLLAITGYMFWQNLFANIRPLHEMEMEVSLIITRMDYCLFVAFQGVRKTKCDVQHTQRVYCPVFTISKFSTSIRTKEKDLISFAILPLHTIIIS